MPKLEILEIMRIRDFLLMRYINLRLLTYLLTYLHIDLDYMI